MTADFTATSPSGNLKPRRKNDGALQVWQKEYKDGPPLGREAFLVEWHLVMRVFSVLYTVEFQIVAIRAELPQAPAPGAKISASTRARYEFVGTGTGFHREQWVGHLDLDWEFAAGEDPRLRTWRNVDESRCRSLAPIFEDQASEAFGQCASFGSQFLPEVDDDWRTILDGASPHRIYGHNGVAAGDIDNDGFDDLYTASRPAFRTAFIETAATAHLRTLPNSGAGVLENTACAIFADIDNDWAPGPHRGPRKRAPAVFECGQGKFRLKPNAFQFAIPRRAHSPGPQSRITTVTAGWTSYFCLYSYYQGADQYRYPGPYYAAENGPPNFLMRNNRDRSHFGTPPGERAGPEQ